ncbi:hypothetical protein Tco_0750800 [Tanacetum coccineum]|uniref:Uncharacterized protein n=1 Tax=Tanacetum coccineum TaxID=301880 RepID=A0ABQ4Z283_9ASTR
MLAKGVGQSVVRRNSTASQMENGDARSVSRPPFQVCLSRHPSLGSSFDSQVSNWEDGISTSSLSEAEEKTIKAVYEQMKSPERGNSRKDTTSTSEIYETVRSEVRLGIADIQDDLQDISYLSYHYITNYVPNGGMAHSELHFTLSEVSYVSLLLWVYCLNTSPALVSTEVTDASKLVKPGAVEFVLDIRREYAKELEESQERARKLDQIWPLRNISSSERKKMSKRLTDEAMSYFDECVSISAFDSSDFSAAEDPSVKSVTTTPIRGATSSGPNRCIDQQMIHDDLGSSSVVASSCNELVMDKVVEITNSTESERKLTFQDSASERSRANYNADAYGLLDVNESLLFDKVFFNNRQESGSMHICGGVAVPFLPLAHLL